MSAGQDSEDNFYRLSMQCIHVHVILIVLAAFSGRQKISWWTKGRRSPPLLLLLPADPLQLVDRPR